MTVRISTGLPAAGVPVHLPEKSGLVWTSPALSSEQRINRATRLMATSGAYSTRLVRRLGMTPQAIATAAVSTMPASHQRFAIIEGRSQQTDRARLFLLIARRNVPEHAPRFPHALHQIGNLELD